MEVLFISTDKRACILFNPKMNKLKADNKEFNHIDIRNIVSPKIGKRRYLVLDNKTIGKVGKILTSPGIRTINFTRTIKMMIYHRLLSYYRAFTHNSFLYNNTHVRKKNNKKMR